MKLTVRLMEKKDLDRLAEIYVEVYTAFDVGEKWTKKAAYNLLDFWLRHQPDLAFVAEYKGAIVGALVAGIKPWLDGNHLFDGEIFVHPEYQNKGIGKVLTKALLRKGLEKYKVTEWDAFTFRNFDFPLSWYKKLGFQEIKELVMISGDAKEALKRLGK